MPLRGKCSHANTLQRVDVRSSSLFSTSTTNPHTPSPCGAATLMATAASPDVIGPQVCTAVVSARPRLIRQQSAKGKEVAAEPQSAQPAEGHSEREKSSPAGEEPPQEDDVGNGNGNASTSDHTEIPHPHPSSSTPPDSAGQAPPPSPPPAAVRSADSIPTPPEENGTARKDKGSLESEQTGTNTFKGSPRKDATKSVSDGVHTSTTEGEPQSDAARARRSKGLLSKLLRVLVPCVGPSSRAHPIDLDEKAQVPPQTSKPRDTPSAGLKEKQEAKELEELPPAPQDPGVTPTDAQASTSDAEIPPPLQPIDIPQQLDDPNVIVPPTPTKTLPLEETEGVTSGAVQPPGSTGEESVHNHSRRNSRDLGDETDGSTSFTDDDELEEGTPVDEIEDEEERLIMQGGAGIPIGPVSDCPCSLLCSKYTTSHDRMVSQDHYFRLSPRNMRVGNA